MPFSNYQNEIYLNGMADIVPEFPIEPAALEAAARERLTPEAFGYVAGSAGTELTARANRDAFARHQIVPRFLCDVSVRDLSTNVLGTPMPAPIALAPVGVQGIVHPDAELAVARAAAGVRLPIALSTVSSYTLEDVAAAGGDSPRWFQLYWPKDRDVGASLLARAKAAGYQALLLTLDTFILAWRPRDLTHAYLPFLHRLGLANYESDPAFLAGLDKSPEEDPVASVLHWQSMFGDPRNTWTDLAWVREHWDGPIALKGVLHPDDARRAVAAGVDGVLVSNHGGRQIDGSIASLDALPGVVAAVSGEVDVLLDSGIRTGSDVIKALALGANAVLLGRPYIYGLGLGGEAGVRHVLRSLLAELDLSMALAGCAKLSDAGPELLTHIP
ncbi:MAG TPA: alpha-hydroxy-acid oxidizing protein [Mycobacteriales bacterium]|nr:alpha-hydroxy-acid oxidizing protein [Mycobacteriales bacterium]